MNETNLYSTTHSTVVYKETIGSDIQAFIFNKDIKTVSIVQEEWIPNEGTFDNWVPQEDSTKHSAKYGHFQASIGSCLGISDIEFIYQKSQQLFKTEEVEK